MNFKNNTFKIVISVGDESGIGPEIILKALHSDEIPEKIDFIIVGSKKILQNTYSHLKSLGLEKLANILIDKCQCNNLIMKLNSQGFISYEKDKNNIILNQHFPALCVNPLDVTGAGDSFCGALAHSLNFKGNESNLEDHIKFALNVASLSVTKKGTQKSYHTLEQVQKVKR